jgi:hypothetical protein
MDQVVVSEFDQAGELLAIYTTRPKEGSTSVQVRATGASADAGINVFASRKRSRRSRRGSGSWTCFSPRGIPRA